MKSKKKLLVVLLLVLVSTLLITASTLAMPKLVSADWLKANLDKSNLVVIDVRSKKVMYSYGHIPGACFMGDAQWRVNQGDVAGLLPPVASITETIKEAGVNNDSDVVIYSEGQSATDIAWSSRILWTFEYLGHENVGILNGGWAAWTKAGNPSSRDQVKVSKGNFTANPQSNLLASKDEVKAALSADSVVLVDSRPPAQYFGVSKSGVVTAYGHLAGAYLFPGQFLTTQGKPVEMLDNKTLQNIAAGTGMPAADGHSFITYCNTGHWASLPYFVLRDVLGYKNVKMYDGSLSDWTHPSVPAGTKMIRYSWDQ